jgi:hypothetical protein
MSSRTVIWLVAIAVVAIAIVFLTSGRDASDLPGTPSPHAIDQDQ